jgi:hypothetical protein
MTIETDRGISETLRYGDKARLVIDYTNTSDTPLQDVSFNLVLSGNAAILSKIDPGYGYYNSQTQTITWNKSIIDDFIKLAPKSNGTLRMIIPIVLIGTNSPYLKLSLTGYGTTEKTNDVTYISSKTWVVQGSVNLKASTNYKNSPFQNIGPIPPKANMETTYNTHYVVSAQNTLINTQVSFILPIYVTWLGITSDSQNIIFDSKTRTVTWLINRLESGKSISADIKLSITPSQSHVNQTPPITSGIVMDTDEEISKAHIHTTISPLTTAIYNEGWIGDPSRVVGQ